MTSGVPWHLRGIRPEVIDSAREAARRAGMSVEEWLDSTIAQSAKSAGIEPAGHQPSDLDDRGAQGSAFSDVSARLDALARQVDRLSQSNTVQPPERRLPPGDDARWPGAFGNAVAPFAASLEQVLSAPSIAGPDGTVDQALAEIEARQRMLDGGNAAAPMDLPRAPSQGLTDLEQQLRQINTRIASMRPCSIDSAVETLRDDLAEIGMMLKEAMPRQAIAALETEIRSLASRVDTERHDGADGAAMAGVERGLAEVRDALQALKPAESLVGLDQAVQGLSLKVDRLANAEPEPAGLKQLEGAIGALRGIVSHVASSDALTQLHDEVRSLATKVDQVTASGAFSAMEQRITALADAFEQSRGAPTGDTAGLKTAMKSLADKVDQLHATRSDQGVLGQLEIQIGTLVEKLNASDARLGHLGGIERGLADLLIQMESQRMTAGRGGIENAEAETLRRDVQRTQDSLETVHGTLGHVVNRLDTIEAGARDFPTRRAVADDFGPEATAPIASVAARPTAPTQPAMFREPSTATHSPLAPDHPLESGAGRSRGSSSPAERIAASGASFERTGSDDESDPTGRSNFIAAARRAAQAAMVETPSSNDRRTPDAAIEGDAGDADKSLTSRLGAHIRKLVVGVSALLLLLGVLHFVSARLWDGTPATGERIESHATHGEAPMAEPPQITPAAPSERQSSVLPLGIPMSPTAFGIGFGAPLPGATDTAAERVTTGSVRSAPAAPALDLLPPASSPQTTPARGTPAERLPPGIGQGLRDAAANGDAAAEFEIASRLAEGRGVPQNLAEAAVWFERAAAKGLIPAQFRLGGLYEKGLGVEKNRETARRIYLKAAEAGHPKAMHNLAVLYAEGLDGKPNYTTAAQWFRKAADYGIGDSQYNLAILYARGIGVETNMAEAFKWFSLASNEGDRDAAKKRDDLAARLDRASLAAAMDAAKAWQAQPQPDAVVQVQVPPSGWDGAPSAGKRAVGPKVDPSQPRRPAQ